MRALRRSPFKVDRIEDDPKAFGLRVEAISSCAEALFNRQSVLISGERGIGKSSLASQFKRAYDGTTTLLRRCNISSSLPTYVCGYASCNSNPSLADLCGSIMYSLEQEYTLLKSMTPTVKKLEFTFDLGVFKARLETELSQRKPGTVAAEFVGALTGLYRSVLLLGMSGISIVIDDVDEIEASTNFGRFFKAVHESLHQARLHDVTFILTGKRGVFERLYREEPSCERIVRHVPISVLTPDESAYILDYASQYADNPFSVTPEARVMILALFTGYPYAVHLLGNAAFNRMDDVSRLSQDDVLMGLSDILQSDKLEKYVLNLRGLDQEERLVLTSMALYASPKLPMEIPTAWIESHLLANIPTGKRLSDILLPLETSGHIVAGPKHEWYRFRDELFRVFLSYDLYAHREYEEERIARRRDFLNERIVNAREDVRRFLRDFRKTDGPPGVLDYTLELLNVSNCEADWDWDRIERAELLNYEDPND